MPTLPANDRGVADAVEVLRSGAPVVLPLPSPLAYVITGTDAAAVNIAKQRPASQSVGVSVADIDVLAAHLDVDEDVLPLARWLCESELVSLLAPARPSAPGWLAPATSDGMVFFTAAPWLTELRRIITTFEHLYMTSANITGELPATTAAQAHEALGDRLHVLDADVLRDQLLAHGSTTMGRLSSTGQLTIARPGINNRHFGTDLTAYADDLARRWQTERTRRNESDRLR
jgi:tRNA A37 threonylcarbamoyladenosine synthetase subunit TsaC/SUA5/YrdC